ncbi:MAG: DUF2948 family protein [Alphaproteobacteria bacterium]
MSAQPLKLKAKDAEDVQVISAVLQDAIAPICDMVFDPAEKSFIMVVHRLRRESGEGLERICCAINMRGVNAAQLNGLDLTQKSLMLDLLAVMLEGASLTFIFAGHAKIRLQLADWAMVVEDFGEAWPAQCNPCHDSDRQAG